MPTDKLVVLRMLDWTIIPIENLLARRGKNLMVQVENSEQARLMVEILEKGVDGVVLNTTDVNEIKKTAEIIHGVSERIEPRRRHDHRHETARHGRPLLPRHLHADDRG